MVSNGWNELNCDIRVDRKLRGVKRSYAPGPCFNMKTIFPGIGVSIIMMSSNGNIFRVTNKNDYFAMFVQVKWIQMNDNLSSERVIRV